MQTLKLKGGALYVALIICMMVSVILGVFILIAHFNHKQVVTQLLRDQLFCDLDAALQLAQSACFDEKVAGSWFVYGDDSVKIKNLQWGAYDLVSAQAKNSRQATSATALYGTWSTPDTAFFTEDAGRTIRLGGKVNFKGGAYFPKTGYRAAYVEGKDFVAAPDLNKFVRISVGKMRPVSQRFINQVLSALKGAFQINDSAGHLPRNYICHPFSAQTLLIEANNLNLSGYTLKGNIKIKAKKITVDHTTQLDNVLLVADKVIFKKGFTGTVQVMARDSIMLERDCRLRYPSSLTLLTEAPGTACIKGIFMADQCRVEGSLLTLSLKTGGAKTMIAAGQGCEIFGLVYAGGMAGIQGSVYGTFYCAELRLQTPSTVYQDHLVNCSVDPKKFSAKFYMPAIFENNRAQKCVKWL